MRKSLGIALVERIRQSGDCSPGAYNLAADLIALASLHAQDWTHRADDAIRIPGMLDDAVRSLRQEATKVAVFGDQRT